MGAGEEGVTLVVAAMEEEIAAFRGRLAEVVTVSVKNARVSVGRYRGTRVALAVTGDGERNARRGLAGVLAALPVREVLVVGVAGALSPGLKVGDLVVCERVLAEDGLEVHAADERLVARFARVPGCQRGLTVTARDVADSAARKQGLLGLAEATVGGTPLSTVDLESAVFATTAARAQLPWVVLRSVSDLASEGLPPLLNASRDDGGAIRRLRVVRGLLTQPSLLKSLLGLRDRVRACADRLCEGIERAVGAEV